MRDKALCAAVSDSIKQLKRLCTCGTTEMRFWHFEYASDLMAFIDGEEVWTSCCPEDDDE